MRLLRSLATVLLALGLGAGIATLTESPTEAQTGYPVIASSVGSAAFPLLGPTDTAGAPNYSWTADPDSGLYSIGANSVGIAVGGANLWTFGATNSTMASGQLLVPAGTAALPALSFSSDTTSGLYLTVNQINFTFDASRAGSISASGLRLNVNGTAALPAIRPNDTNSGWYIIGADNIGMSVGGALVMDWEDTNAAGAGADLVTISSTLGIMNGSDTVRGLFIDLTNADHTGTGNTLVGLDIDTLTGDANSDLSAIRIGALTGTAGAAGELEYAIESLGGYDAAFRDVGVAFANLQAADNGSFVYCTDCDPSTSPCASVAGQTGAWAFRQNGAWECPIP